MKKLWLVCFCVGIGLRPLVADTIYETNSEGSEIVLQRNAIVTHQDSSFVVYKHFDLKERRVTEVRLSRGSLPFRIETSDTAQRAQIVTAWKRFGYKASITDQAGKVTDVDDLYLDFYPPGGRGSLLESIPARTNLPVLIDNAGPDEVEFTKIDHIEVRGERLNLVLRDGKTISGKFLMPTTQPAEARILGITENYDPASRDVFDYAMPLSRLKSISFK